MGLTLVWFDWYGESLGGDNLYGVAPKTTKSRQWAYINLPVVQLTEHRT